MLKIHTPELTPELLAESEQIAAMPDDTIDTSDMPEVTDWSGWERGKFYRPVKQQLTLRLDSDPIHWFKSRQGGKRGYQNAINAALRKVMEEAQGDRQMSRARHRPLPSGVAPR